MNDGEKGSTAEFDDFVASGTVEVGEGTPTDQPEDKPAKPAARKNPPKAPEVKENPAAGDDQAGAEDQGDEDQGGEDQGDEDQGGDDDQKGKTARDHQIERLKREKAELRRQLRENSNSELSRRLEMLEKSLQGGNGGDNSPKEIPAPDPLDTDKYPLGHLDDRYIEDKLEWLADKKAAERADAVLQRQQENEQRTAASQQQQELLGKVDELSSRGIDLFEDFQETVVEAGMRGDWDLSQATFEAAHEADNGPQILYDLAQDKKEASRVAKLSPYQQLKYVQERDAEITKANSGRKIPRAGDPPANPARGASSRMQINPATDNLDDFEKAWAADAKKH